VTKHIDAEIDDDLWVMRKRKIDDVRARIAKVAKKFERA
jgi:hypothetical protein